jgi:hypothetical protein
VIDGTAIANTLRKAGFSLNFSLKTEQFVADLEHFFKRASVRYDAEPDADKAYDIISSL